MLSGVIERVRVTATRVIGRIADVARTATRPAPVVLGLLRDVTRSREELVAENILLRQQLIVAARASKRPKFAAHERGMLLLLARLLPRWRDAVLLRRQRKPGRSSRSRF